MLLEAVHGYPGHLVLELWYVVELQCEAHGCRRRTVDASRRVATHCVMFFFAAGPSMKLCLLHTIARLPSVLLRQTPTRLAGQVQVHVQVHVHVQVQVQGPLRTLCQPLQQPLRV